MKVCGGSLGNQIRMAMRPVRLLAVDSAALPKRLFYLAVMGCLALSACARPMAPPAEKIPPDMGEILLQKLKDHAADFDSLSALARVRMSSESRTMGGRQVLLAEKPNRLRAEVLSPFGQPLLILATDGSEVYVWDISEGKLYRGNASSGTIQRLLGLPIKLMDLIGILLYDPPLISHEQPVVFPAEGGGYLMILRGEDEWEQRMLFDRDLNLTKADFYHHENPVVLTEYADFDSEHSFPLKISVGMPERSAEASLSFSELKLNPHLPRERFTLEPPQGVRILPLQEEEKTLESLDLH